MYAPSQGREGCVLISLSLYVDTICLGIELKTSSVIQSKCTQAKEMQFFEPVAKSMGINVCANFLQSRWRNVSTDCSYVEWNILELNRVLRWMLVDWTFNPPSLTLWNHNIQELTNFIFWERWDAFFFKSFEIHKIFALYFLIQIVSNLRWIIWHVCSQIFMND